MIRAEHLDIRTVTMGISLLDCADADADALCRKIYEKIMNGAGRLVPVCEHDRKGAGDSDRPQADRRHPDCAPGRGHPGGRISGCRPDARPRGIRGRRQLHRRLFGPRAQGIHPRRHRPDQRPSRSAGRHGEGLRVGEPGDQQGGDQHGRRGDDGPDHQADGRADRARGEHRLREARRLLQCPGGQPLHGGRVSRDRRAGNGDQRRGQRPRRRPPCRPGEPGSRLRGARRDHQEDRLQDHADGGARRTDGLRAAGHAFRDRRSLPRPHAGRRRQHRGDPRGDGHRDAAGRRERRRRWRSSTTPSRRAARWPLPRSAASAGPSSP